MKNIRNVFMPEVYQGENRKSPYFEGWYYKITSPGGDVFCFIPGIHLNRNDSHCFVQVIGTALPTALYIRYPEETFYYKKNDLFIKVGNNVFTREGFSVSIRHASGLIKGNIRFTHPLYFSENSYH